MSLQQDGQPLDRLYRRLAEALRRAHVDPFVAPVTVAEIYQELVPYRSMRTEAGFEESADYEHTLLRLLAGEAALARLEPAEAREEIARELRFPAPNVSIYRAYAGCDVWIAPSSFDPAFDPAATAVDGGTASGTGSATPADADAGSSADERGIGAPAGQSGARPTFSFLDLDNDVEAAPAEGPEERRSAEDEEGGQATPSTGAAAESSLAAASAGDDLEAAGGGPDAATQARPSRCGFCDSELPAQRRVRYCPFCGADQSTRPCTACGEALEPGWSFCVGCGSAD
jgi:hypothetical protein